MHGDPTAPENLRNTGSRLTTAVAAILPDKRLDNIAYRSTAASISPQSIFKARQRIAGSIRATPLIASQSLSKATGTDVHLKLEHLQTTGSFKLRGAMNAVLSLSQEQRARGIVGASTGNHGRGLAYAARDAGTRCVICMSELVPTNKVDGIRALGADVRVIGRSQDDAQLEVDRLVAEEGMVMLPPFDHADIIAGQGTLGVEILEPRRRFTLTISPL